MAEAKVKAIVAKGRTLAGDDPVIKQTVASPDGKSTMEVPARKVFTQGMEIELPASKVDELRAAGHLVDPNQAPEPPPAPGARITEK